MVTQTDLFEEIKSLLTQSQKVPSATTILATEIDDTGSQSAIRPPAIEITQQSSDRITTHNTDFVSFVTDGAGNQIGFLFETYFEMVVNLNILVADGDGFDERSIGEAVRNVLYQYDSQMIGENPPNPIERLTITSFNQDNDLTMTPALRQVSLQLNVLFKEQVDTTDLTGTAPFVTEVRSGDGTVIAAQDTSQTSELTVSNVDNNELQFITT